MKKYLFAAVCTLLTSTVSAEPTKHDVTFTCPAINAIAHFGDYVAGYGSESIFGDIRPVYFKTNLWPIGIPSTLSTYSSSATHYDSITALITCSYISSDVNNTAFDLLYHMANGRGGFVTAQTLNMISLQFPIGFTK